ncbi:aldose epimerase family protein [Asticcacaulis sp.]|uniref:aldose epimerase family protein n=1 Tax=Asticcacaulis sp. TaxID=1872648 RepID=UPI002C2484C7|nr:aldose epimerase family protein [Asticcacaulis sp.]HTM82938.1 aldose epimerase family protein [Asticcacaulis sp.]
MIRFIAPALLFSLGLAGAANARCILTVSDFGVMASGEKVQAYRFDDGDLAVTVLSLGGIIHDIDAPDSKGHRINVVRNLENLAAYEQRDNFSSLIGRFANRLGSGGITIDGQTYPLPGNARGVTMHGGAKSFGSRLWSVRPLGSEACGVELSLVSPDGDNGFPGALGVTVRYTLSQNRLTLTYTARTTRPTVINLTHHAYFNLAGNGDVYGHTLRLNASHYLPVDKLRLPTGELAPVGGTEQDWRKTRPISNGGQALDETFVLDGKPAAVLHDPVSGRTLTVSTTEPGLIAYTAGGFDGSLIDARHRHLPAGAGIALEAQHFPDSPHHDNFPPTVLRPGETWRSETTYAFDMR